MLEVIIKILFLIYYYCAIFFIELRLLKSEVKTCLKK